jgi:hypothetical protein
MKRQRQTLVAASQNATASCTSARRRERRCSTAIDLYFRDINDDELVVRVGRSDPLPGIVWYL